MSGLEDMFLPCLHLLPVLSCHLGTTKACSCYSVYHSDDPPPSKSQFKKKDRSHNAFVQGVRGKTLSASSSTRDVVVHSPVSETRFALQMNPSEDLHKLIGRKARDSMWTSNNASRETRKPAFHGASVHTIFIHVIASYGRCLAGSSLHLTFSEGFSMFSAFLT